MHHRVCSTRSDGRIRLIFCRQCAAGAQVLCRHGSSDGHAEQTAVADSSPNHHFGPHGADDHRHCAADYRTRRAVSHCCSVLLELSSDQFFKIALFAAIKNNRTLMRY